MLDRASTSTAEKGQQLGRSTKERQDCCIVVVRELAAILSRRPDDIMIAEWLIEKARELQRLRLQLAEEICQALYAPALPPKAD
jgi:hypothetical protein